jgi:hypothetical protein
MKRNLNFGICSFLLPPLERHFRKSVQLEGGGRVFCDYSNREQTWLKVPEWPKVREWLKVRNFISRVFDVRDSNK